MEDLLGIASSARDTGGRGSIGDPQAVTRVSSMHMVLHSAI